MPTKSALINQETMRKEMLENFKYETLDLDQETLEYLEVLKSEYCCFEIGDYSVYFCNVSFLIHKENASQLFEISLDDYEDDLLLQDELFKAVKIQAELDKYQLSLF